MRAGSPDPAPSPTNLVDAGSRASDTPRYRRRGRGAYLARKLTGFASTLRLTTTQLRPHFLCTYLYEVAGEFSSFYTADKVLVDDPAIRARRLLLCARTLLVLETGLRLLGLRPLPRM